MTKERDLLKENGWSFMEDNRGEMWKKGYFRMAKRHILYPWVLVYLDTENESFKEIKEYNAITDDSLKEISDIIEFRLLTDKEVKIYCERKRLKAAFNELVDLVYNEVLTGDRKEHLKRIIDITEQQKILREITGKFYYFFPCRNYRHGFQKESNHHSRCIVCGLKREDYENAIN